jgi:small-conductance mechanosensitive channel
MKNRLTIVVLICLSFLPLLSQTDTSTTAKKPIPKFDTLVMPASVRRDTLVILVEQKGSRNLLQQLGNTDSAAADDDSAPPDIGEILSFGKITWSIVILVVGFFIIRFTMKSLEFISEKSTRNRGATKRYGPMVQIFGWITFIYIVIAGVIHPPAETIIAVSASLGIAVGFASQDILKNIFAGIVILFDRPFSVGDKIEIGSTYGEVKKIGLRSTRIETADDSLVAVPNAELMNQLVSNSNSGEENCQVVAEIYLPITVDTEKVRRIATEAAQVSRFIYLNKPIAVLFFNEVKERRSYYKVRLKAYVMDTRYEFAFKSDMTELVMRELLAANVISPNEML